jgi:nicotinamidase-related amidase
MKTNTTLIIIDFIHDIVHPDGKLSGKGYSDFITRHGTDKRVGELLLTARSNHWLICHVRIGFEPDYSDYPENSPLFGAAKQYNALNKAEWGYEFIDYAKPLANEPVIAKSRVSAFFNTDLETILQEHAISNIFICGCSTDLAVQAVVRDAHDRDYAVTVVSDACAAATDVDHTSSLSTLAKIAQIKEVGEL